MRPHGSSVHLAAVAAVAVCGFFSTSAFANKDIPYPSGATATVSSVAVGVTNNFAEGTAGSTTLDEAVYTGQHVSVSATWSIKDNHLGPGQDTIYGTGLAITFTPSTTATPGPSVSVSAISNCSVTSASSTCARSIDFDAPATPGDYQVTITLGGTGFNGANGLTQPSGGSVLRVNFSVAEPVVVLDTKLTVAKQCVLLHAGDIELSAQLEELVSGDPIAGAGVDFYIDPPSSSVGTGTTDGAGEATWTYNVDSLSVGDHNLYAEYAGDSSYNPSNDSDILGISYLFAGFQPPINPEGNSVFGNGRVIPIKIKLADANGVPVADATPHVYLTQYSTSTGLGEDLEPASSVSAADTGNVMRYDPDAGQYIYNWDLSSLENGTYAVVVDLGDSAACSQGSHYAVITVAKKKK